MKDMVAPKKPRRIPQRTCVACRTTGGKRGLLRVVRLPGNGGIALDPTGKRNGRGAYICSTPECVTLALKRKALERALKVPLPEEVVALLRAAVATTETLATTPVLHDKEEVPAKSG
jgi:predicted RNA-binding protein YlxR (DUF448 family)